VAFLNAQVNLINNILIATSASKTLHLPYIYFLLLGWW